MNADAETNGEFQESDDLDRRRDLEFLRLQQLYEATPEHIEKQSAIHRAERSIIDGQVRRWVDIRIEIPDGMRDLVRFSRGKGLLCGSVNPGLEGVLRRVAENAFLDLLHALTVDDQSSPYYRKVWNRVCDEAGLPEHRNDPPLKIASLDDDIPF